MISFLIFLSSLSISFLHAANSENGELVESIREVDFTNESSNPVLVLLPECFNNRAVGQGGPYVSYPANMKILPSKGMRILVGLSTQLVIVDNPSPYYVFKKEGQEVELPSDIDSFVVSQKEDDNRLVFVENLEVTIKGE